MTVARGMGRSASRTWCGFMSRTTNSNGIAQNTKSTSSRYVVVRAIIGTIALVLLAIVWRQVSHIYWNTASVRGVKAGNLDSVTRALDHGADANLRVVHVDQEDHGVMVIFRTLLHPRDRGDGATPLMILFGLDQFNAEATAQQRNSVPIRHGLCPYFLRIPRTQT